MRPERGRAFVGYSMPTPSDLRRLIERRLYGLGFTAPIVRHMLCTQIILAGTGLIIGAALAWYSLGPLAFGVGAAIATYSLWSIARFAQSCIYYQFSAALGIRLFLGFTVRIVFVGIVLYGLIVLLRAPIVPLVLGLSSTVAGIALWGLARFSRKTV